MRTSRLRDYREIIARFDSTATACGSNDGGHGITKGDIIGYAPRTKATMCAECWRTWVAENREADAIEAGYSPCGW